MADEPSDMGGLDDDGALTDVGGMGGDAGDLMAEPPSAGAASPAPLKSVKRSAPRRKAAAKGKSKSAKGAKKGGKAKAAKRGKAKAKKAAPARRKAAKGKGKKKAARKKR